jgi:excisionase family DNA binding protein
MRIVSSSDQSRNADAEGELMSEPQRKPPSPADPASRDFEPLLDSEEAAALLKIHPKTLQKLARDGEVDAIQIGKLWRFRASALNRWLEKIAS